MGDNKPPVYHAHLFINRFHQLWHTNTKALHSTDIFKHGSGPNPKLNCNTAHTLSGKKEPMNQTK